RNPNLLLWHRKLWLIDHGAALYMHHTWADYIARATSPFAAIKDHVLLPAASAIAEADALLAPRITPELIGSLVGALPDTWLESSAFATPDEHRTAYSAYLLRRLEAPRAFVEEAIRAHTQRV
ncbi:MAG: aminotransferase class I and II, partial [Chloroflexaceae bacterium]|nr:aminotransferase class I and II [Chloroflexaceae bacterium]